MDQLLGVFAKYWEPGRVKTRLARSIGFETASDLHRLFVEFLTRSLADYPADRTVYFSPDHRHSEFARVAGDAWSCHPQCTGDLGQRMLDYFHTAFARGHRRVVLIGSDAPQITRVVIDEAYEALKQVDVVLGPTEDGGYYLIGMQGRAYDVFHEIPWSTPVVWQATLDQLANKAVRYHMLSQDYDIDTQTELQRLLDDQRVDSALRRDVAALLHG